MRLRVMDKSKIKTETQQVIEDVLEKIGLREGSLFVLGRSFRWPYWQGIQPRNWGNHCEDYPRYPRGKRNSSSRSRL